MEERLIETSLSERILRRERQLEGIAKAKAARVYKGRKPTIERETTEALRVQGLGATRSPLDR
jgi:DNA invertase Pin-like site-specific DNA recombinase